jgi:short-subunit dehydrogenase
MIIRIVGIGPRPPGGETVMVSFTNQTALVTGASSGIGEVFARALAARGAHLVLVARSADKLDALARELSRVHGVRAEVIAADLSRPGAALEVAREAERRRLAVDVLVNNAGVGAHGRFEELSAARQHEQVQLNVTAVVDLSRAFLPGMLARGRGAIVNVASTASFQPVPYMAVYGATKAFVLSFSEALWAEARGRGVAVLALCPGPTETAFFQVAGEGAAFGRKEPAELVVDRALRALARNRSHVISGAPNWLVAQLSRVFPRGLVARVVARLMRPVRPAPATESPGAGAA